MCQVKFISDLHISHKNVLNFSPQHRLNADSIESHDLMLMHLIRNSVTKRDRLYILGDLILGDASLDIFDSIPCDKILVRGNHDDRFNASDFLTVFKDVLGIVLYKKHWLTHCPIHPDELRGKGNIHGHVHTNSIRDHYHQPDPRYINVCVEALDGVPIAYQDIINGTYNRIRRC